MTIGGFNGSDPYATLEQFQHTSPTARVHYFIAGGRLGGGAVDGRTSASSEIQPWVEENFTATTVDGVTLYHLTQAT